MALLSLSLRKVNDMAFKYTLIVLFFSIFSAVASDRGDSMAGAMSVFPIDVKMISEGLNGQGDVMYFASGEQLTKAGFEVILPSEIRNNGTLVLTSSKTGMVIYKGDYKNGQIIILDIDEQLLSDGGLDLLGIQFWDVDRKLLYSCEQQKAFKIWAPKSIVTINVLPQPKPDGLIQGSMYCYDAYIHKAIKK